MFYSADSVIVSFDCVNEYIVFCTLNGSLYFLKNNVVERVEDGGYMDVALSVSLGLVCVCAVGDKVVVYENERRMEVDGKGDSVKWSSAGYCFVVGDGVVCRCYGPDSDGRFKEIELEEMK